MKQNQKKIFKYKNTDIFVRVVVLSNKKLFTLKPKRKCIRWFYATKPRAHCQSYKTTITHIKQGVQVALIQTLKSSLNLISTSCWQRVQTFDFFKRKFGWLMGSRWFIILNFKQFQHVEKIGL